MPGLYPEFSTSSSSAGPHLIILLISLQQTNLIAMNLERFDIGSWPPSRRPSWFTLVVTRAISGGCSTEGAALAWEEEVKRLLNKDPHAVCTPRKHASIMLNTTFYVEIAIWVDWKKDQCGECSLAEDLMQTVYIQWVYLRAMGRPESAHEVLQFANDRVVSQGLPVCYSGWTFN